MFLQTLLLDTKDENIKWIITTCDQNTTIVHAKENSGRYQMIVNLRQSKYHKESNIAILQNYPDIQKD